MISNIVANKIEVLKVPSNSKKHIVHFPGFNRGFRHRFFAMHNRCKCDSSFDKHGCIENEGAGLSKYQKNQFFGQGIFSAEGSEYNFHCLNYHTNSIQSSTSSKLLNNFFIVSLLYYNFHLLRFCNSNLSTVILNIIFIDASYFALKKNLFTERLMNFLRFFARPQDSIDAGVAYVYSLLKEGVHPSNITLHGFCWGGHVSTEVLRIFEEKGVYLTLVTESSFASQPMNLINGMAGINIRKFAEFLATLFRANYKFNPLETIKKIDSPVLIIKKQGDEVISSEHCLYDQYYKYVNEQNGEIKGLKVLIDTKVKDSVKDSNRSVHCIRFKYLDTVVKCKFLSFDQVVNEEEQFFCAQAEHYSQKLNERYDFSKLDKTIFEKPHIKFIKYKRVVKKEVCSSLEEDPSVNISLEAQRTSSVENSSHAYGGQVK